MAGEVRDAESNSWRLQFDALVSVQLDGVGERCSEMPFAFRKVVGR